MGISFDTPDDQLAFAGGQNFGYTLLCDTTKEIGEAYEAKKGPDEQWADFPRRISYLIDPDGVIVKGYEVTDVGGHSSEVLADILAAQVA